MQSNEFISITNASSEGMMLCEATGKIVAANPAVLKMLCLSPADLPTNLQTLFDFSDTDIANLVKGYCRSSLPSYIPAHIFKKYAEKKLQYASYVVAKDNNNKILRILLRLNNNQEESRKFHELTTRLNTQNKILLELQNKNDQLKKNELQLKSALEGVGDQAWILDLNNLNLNPPNKNDLINALDQQVQKWTGKLHPEDYMQSLNLLYEHIIGNTEAYYSEHRLLSHNNEYRWTLTRGKVIALDNSHSSIKVVGIHTDITQARQMKAAIIEVQDNMSVLLNSMKDGVFVARDYRFVYVNPALAAMLGYDISEFVSFEFSQVVHKDDLELCTSNFKQRIDGEAVDSRYEIKLINRDQDTLIMAEISATRLIFQGKLAVMGIVRDISDKKKSDQLIWKQANFDGVTGLPNRYMFQEKLDQELMRSTRNGTCLCLMFIDLDNFKEINDTLGHNYGDMLLKGVASRLAEYIRKTDTLSRLGGDEFTIIFPEISSTQETDIIAQNILKLFNKPFEFDNVVAHMTASIGIAFAPLDSNNIDDLMKHADQAMYNAKFNGKNHYSYFSTTMMNEAINKRTLLNDLHVAIEHQQFFLEYQPIFNIQSGEVYKAEALLRWNHPIRGIVSPLEFIPLAEESGLILPIGDWLINEVIKQARFILENYDSNFQISINKSPIQLKSKDVHYKDYAAILEEEAPSIAGAIIVEITESTLLQEEKVVRDRLLKFRDLGVEVAVDDFGTGYSSLAYLTQFDVDYLKIDKSFISKLGNKPDDALCEAIILMAHKLGIKVVAEGVEREDQYQKLKQISCDYAQGYYLSKPLTMEKLQNFIKERLSHKTA